MNKTCKECAVIFNAGTPSHARKRLFCSRKCRGVWESREKRGANNHAWRDEAERFWEKVKKTDGCWLWIGGKFKYGYGAFGGRKHDRAHRVSYEMAYGPIPHGLFVCHHCDNPACVRPDHLFVGTNNDNIQDSVRKGRRRGAPLEKNWVHLHPNAVRGENNPNAKLTRAQVENIRKTYVPRKVTRIELASKYGVNKSCIDRILASTSWN